jgi:uncharacterized C2H2 Zn-finger protein
MEIEGEGEGKIKIKVHCPKCDKNILQKNFERHMNDMHNQVFDYTQITLMGVLKFGFMLTFVLMWVGLFYFCVT